MQQRNEDPVVRSARREASIAVIVWLAAMTYTVGYCWRHAYGRTSDELKLVLGAPDWVMWGIVLPWGVCVVICGWFAYRFMRDEPLGVEAAPPDDEGNSREQ